MSSMRICNYISTGGEGGSGTGCSVEEVGGDAIALYDTYLSLQVTNYRSHFDTLSMPCTLNPFSLTVTVLFTPTAGAETGQLRAHYPGYC